MKTLFALISLFIFPIFIIGQNGKILERTQIDFKTNKKIKNRLLDTNTQHYRSKYTYLNNVIVEEITYLSDGNQVKGWLAYPKNKGNYPCVLYNRGGNNDFGALNIYKAAFILAKVASWGYVVAGSQYRSNMGGIGGKDEFGGAEVNDIFNLIPLLAKMQQADTSKIGLYGWSRGGMMTYLCLKKSCKFKAAVVGGGVSDLRMVMKTRPDTFETVYIDNIPGYLKNKEKCLDERSAIVFADKICKTTPILILHGTSDWRVVPQMALELSSAFIKYKVPHRLVILEGGNHGLSEFNDEVDEMVKDWFEKYLKNDVPLPDLNPHGK